MIPDAASEHAVSGNQGLAISWVLCAGQVITMKDLRDCGAVHRKVGDGIKLLARVSSVPLIPTP